MSDPIAETDEPSPEAAKQAEEKPAPEPPEDDDTSGHRLNSDRSIKHDVVPLR